jgi:hypothetical protein
MTIELDHIFLLTDVGADREARILLDAGLTEGPPNTHPGQGTACRRFFLDNAYIELLWISDEREAASPLCTPTGLLARWLGRHADTCPIGICTRPASAASISPPFPTWRYAPPYLPPGLHIDMALDTHDPSIPLYFHLCFAQPPITSPRIPRDSLFHPSGLCKLAHASIAGPRATATAYTATPANLVLCHADAWSLTFRIDDGTQSGSCISLSLP